MTNAAEDNIKMAAGVAWRCQPPVLIIAPRGLAEGCERGKDASAEKYNAQDYFIFKGAYAARTARRGWKKSSLSLSFSLLHGRGDAAAAAGDLDF